MYDELQTLENPALRDYLKLDKSVKAWWSIDPTRTTLPIP